MASEPAAMAKRDLKSLESPSKLAFSAAPASSCREVEQLIRSAPASPVKLVSALGEGAAAETPASPDVSPGPSPDMPRAIKRAALRKSDAVHEAEHPYNAAAKKKGKFEVFVANKKKVAKVRDMGRSKKAALLDVGVGSPCVDLEAGVSTCGGAAAAGGQGSPSLRRAALKAPPSPPSPLSCSNIFSLLAGLGSACKTPDLEAAMGGEREPPTAGRSLEGDLDAVAVAEPRGFFGRIKAAVGSVVGGVVSAVKSGWRALGGLFRRGP